MKNFSFLSRPLFSFLAAGMLLFGAVGLFILPSEAAGDDTVQNVVATPYNGGAVLSWNEVSGASSYEVSYGMYSVSEGLAAVYDSVVQTTGNVASSSLQELTNGVKYYAAVKAVFADGKKSASFSNEVDFTPSSIYDALPGNAEMAAASEDEAPRVDSAMALTKNMIKVVFSKEIVLPEILPELSFMVVKNNDSEGQNLPVKKVEYKADYQGEENELLHKDIVFITLDEDLDVDSEYTVTVSAAVVDEDGTPLISGATDFAQFSGTDRTEIPAEEKPLTSGENAPVTPPQEDTTGSSTTPPAVQDTTPPENVTNLNAVSKERENDFWIDLTWTKSTSPDVADQKFYQGTAPGTYGTAVSLGKDADKYGTAAAPETEVTYKITALDAAGNESSGTITSIKLPKLASTGAPFILLAFGTTFALSGFRKMRNK